MGFGLLLLGYMTVLSFFPDLAAVFLYFGYAVFVQITGGAIILAAFIKLQEYNIYFKIVKYIAVIYILAALGSAPFFLFEQSEEIIEAYLNISRIVKILLLFAFHYVTLSGIFAMAKSIDNNKILTGAKINIYFTYVYFGASVFNIIFINFYYSIFVLALGLIYFSRNLLCIYRCFTQIGYEARG